MGRLFFNLYHAGLSNCRMSLDIGVGLAYLTGRTFVPYGVKPPWTSDPLLRQEEDYAEPATVLDLFHLPVPVEREYSGESRFASSCVRRPWSGDVVDSVLVMHPGLGLAGEDFRAFFNRRKHVWTLGQESAGDGDLLMDEPTLGLYSHFFYGGSSSQAELRAVLRGIRPKRPYRELAKRVADSLAPFNAVHIRRGDFPSSRLSPRAHRVTGSEVTRNIATRLSRRGRLVVCTDSSSDESWFAPLHRHFRDVVYIDQMLLHEWRAEFCALPFHDDTVLALMTQLVAERAECFVGTLFSTFTALIQRARGLKGRQSEFLYCYSDWDPKFVPFKYCEFVPVQDGPYSWNRVLYPVCPGVHSWFREWPESFATASAAYGSKVAPEGTVLLPACEAQVRGIEARYEQSNLLDNIGYWTNPDDYVTWDFFLQFGNTYAIEIRCACPEECAGSTFLIELDNGENVTGEVAATGDWTIFSSWQRLGRTNLGPGEHVLSVRILTMPNYAAMNLAAVRLVPTH